MAAPNIRDIILDILIDINKNGHYCHIALHRALTEHQYLSKRDRAFITRVCEGTTERMIEIDYIIDQVSSVSVSRMKPVIRNIIRSAVYQICFMGGVPDSAAVNEAVLLTQSRGFYNLKGFVNGVLRGIVRNMDTVKYPDPEKDRPAYLSVTYSMPPWIVREWMADYGPDVTEMMLKSFMEEKPTTVRLTTQVPKEKILDSLKAQDVHVKKAPYLPYAYNISGYNFLPALEAFKEGWIFPQDVSSMLVAEAAGLHTGDTVIDVCAAPGGKSLHAADKLAGSGSVDSRDLTADKVALIEENVTRSGLANIHPRKADALVCDRSCEEKADVVFCDLPCSGLGVIGRKPDIKYKASDEKIDELCDLQKRILHNAATYVKPGGTLIYSTCTVSRRENLENFRWFLENEDFRADSLDPYLPARLHRLTTAEGYLQLIPGVHESDGFFVARFVKDRT